MTGGADRRFNARVALTYANDRFQDGAGAQLQRIYGIYALSRLKGVAYVHSPLTEVGYQGLAALERNSGSPDVVPEYNRVFRIPSDIDLPEEFVSHTLQDADDQYIEEVKSAANRDGTFHLIRIVLPYTVIDRDAESYRVVRTVSPFHYRGSGVFRLAIHVRRGDLFAIDSERMLPNLYYVNCALRFAEYFQKLGIPFVCELYTEVPSKRFEVSRQHHGMCGRLAHNVTLDPLLNQLGDFDAIPNLERLLNTDPIDALRRMATADGLIMSRSSFSYVAAILSRGIIAVYRPFHHPAMADWLVAEEDGSFAEPRLNDLLNEWKRRSLPFAAGGAPSRFSAPTQSKPSLPEWLEATREAVTRTAAHHGATGVRAIGLVSRDSGRFEDDIGILAAWRDGGDPDGFRSEIEGLLGKKAVVAECDGSDRGTAMALYRDLVRPCILVTAPVAVTNHGQCEVHALTCRGDWLNLIWALKSFYHYSQRRYALCIHDDGTVPPEGMRNLREHFPGARLIGREEADAKAEVELRPYPRCLEFRRRHPLAPKILDFPAFLESARMLLFDSDLLFFAEPTALLDRIEDPAYRRNAFNRDFENGYTQPLETLREHIGHELLPFINGGLGLVQKGSLRADWCEEYLGLPGVIGGQRWWNEEQTLIALCGSRHGAEFLPEEYAVRLSAGAGGLPMRHYLGRIRQELMYTEGVRALVEQDFLPWRFVELFRCDRGPTPQWRETMNWPEAELAASDRRASGGAELKSLLEPFLAQALRIQSVAVIRRGEISGNWGGGDSRGEGVLLRLRPDGDSGSNAPESFPIEDIDSLESLAARVRELAGSAEGEDLIVLPAWFLEEKLPSLDHGCSLRAVVTLATESPCAGSEDGSWRLRRSMFDRGLICIGSAAIAGRRALFFLVSDSVRAFDRLNVEPRGHIAMPSVADGAGFANQLWRYCFGKLYALRHGLAAAFPEWPGSFSYRLKDEPCAGMSLPVVEYPAFSENIRELWQADDPPANFEARGYFQELPECWRPHRTLLRNMFQLPRENRDAIESWRDRVTGGHRALVAIHLRRGDYREHQGPGVCHFQIVPEEWYLEWLRELWPTLHDPVLFVATDEPEVIVPVFAEFAPVSAELGPEAQSIPDHLRDFEIMRRADYLAICNSTFSYMASILASDSQKCFIPSFHTLRFEPYEPWKDEAFWRRFQGGWKPKAVQGAAPKVIRQAPACDRSTAPAAIFIDVSSLIMDLLHQTTLSGIQRVQAEILRNLPESPHHVNFAVLNRGGGLFTVDRSRLLETVESVCLNTARRIDIEYGLRLLLQEAVPCVVRRGDIFVESGAFWNIRGTGMLLQSLKSLGAIIGVFVHDIIPIVSPEYFEAGTASVFTKGLFEALTFADFVLTSSEFNRSCLAERMPAGLEPLIHVVPLGHGFSRPVEGDAAVSQAVADILDKPFVLCVGTIEVRKNPIYLLNVWKMMAQAGPGNMPTLVFAGRRGWMVDDFLKQLAACDYLGGRIAVLHGVSDTELDLLYQKCILTVFPSFVEGWGLPVGESLSHGKVCLCSAVGGIPEAGGDLVDFIDPFNAREGLEKLSRYLDDPDLRRRRECEIAERFQPQSWKDAAEMLVGSMLALAEQAHPLERAAAITLPPDHFLLVSSDGMAAKMSELDGRLSAELICVSGWRAPEAAGVRAADPAAAIRFRAEMPEGSNIHLVLQLAASGRAFRIRIESGSGAGTETKVESGFERMVILPCAVEKDRLVTARLLSIGATLVGDPDDAYWSLKGIRYFGQPVPSSSVVTSEPETAAPPDCCWPAEDLELQIGRSLDPDWQITD